MTGLSLAVTPEIRVATATPQEIPRKDGQGGQLGWFIYMGESGDPKAELGKLVEEAKQEAPAAGEPAPAPAPAPAP